MTASSGARRVRSGEGGSPALALDMGAIGAAERLCDLLLAGGDEGEVAAALNDELQGIQLSWDPETRDLPTTAMRATQAYWQSLPRSAGVPEVLQVEPERLRAALGYIMLVDVGEETGDFRYALYGSKIAAVSGFDLTGKSIWDIPTLSAIQVFFAACYLAVGRSRRPLYSVHEAPPTITVSAWHRLILPLGRADEVRRFLVCNQPLKGLHPH